MTKKPLIWAHRGASAYAPENTLPSFQKAISLNADGVELDVQLTKDGEMVVLHDEEINRTSDHRGYVKDFTLAELKKMNFNNGKEEYGFVEIPTLREVFEVIKPSTLTIDIEIKTGIFFYPGIEKKVVDLVHEFGLEDRVNYSSFNHYSCAKIRELEPNAYVGFLYQDILFDFPAYAKAHGADSINPGIYHLQMPEVVKEAHDLGLEVLVWTVDEEEHIRGCIALGVDVIITNKPDFVRQIVEEYDYD